MAERKELNAEDTGRVNGGAYITTSMTIGQIIETDHNLAGILAQSGISAFGNKSVMGMSLYEAAQTRGVDADALENIMNDYLGSK